MRIKYNHISVFSDTRTSQGEQRMKMRKWSALLSVLLILTAAITGCGGKEKAGRLKVGVRDDIMNFGYLNKDTGR